MKNLEVFAIENWNNAISQDIKLKAVKALEKGKVLYFPNLVFQVQKDEIPLLSPDKVEPKTKNISYDIRNDRLAGTLFENHEADQLKEFMMRYAITTRNFLNELIPHYNAHLDQAKTSFRPVEIFGRKNPSYRKDDTRLHVDSFPSNPTKGNRILRVFSNVNPDNKPRVWRVGEPFENVAKKMIPRVSHPIFGVAQLLKLLKITKDYRTQYDHYMLQIHDAMKKDVDYQKTAPQEEIKFPTGSTWIVYTDQVSHAAMSGQHVLEQTFHLPVQGLNNPATAPLKVLERLLNKPLI